MNKAIKVKIEVKLKPFNTPNFVLVDEPPRARDEGFVESRKYSLGELDSYTLSRMCDDFREEIFKKAGKREPPQSA